MAFEFVARNGIIAKNNVVVSGSLAVTGSDITLNGVSLVRADQTSSLTTLSSSFATTASFASTASYIANAQSASYVLNAQSASYVANAQTASYVENAQTASYVTLAQTASYVQNAQSASYVLNAISASYAATASSADNLTVRGTLTAQTIVAQTVTSSIEFVTGSTRNGSLSSNTHEFTGSVGITGSLAINGTTAVVGTGTINELSYWVTANSVGALSVATYPSLTEISYVKGVTSAIQTQINTKQATITLTTTGTSGAATFSSNTLNIPNYGSALSGYLPLTGGTLTGALGGTNATFSGNIGIGSPPTQAAQFDLFGGNQLNLLTYSGFGNRSGSDLLINSYILPSGSLYQRVTDLVSLGDDVNGRESIFRFITTNTSNSTASRLTISGNAITASLLSTFVGGATINDVFKIYSLTTSAGVVLQGYTGGLRIAVNGSGESGGARGDLLAAAADFSGALSGTSASFSSLVTISADSGGSALRIIGRATADAGAVRFFANNNTTQNARIESNSSEFEINSISSLPITLKTNDTTRLTIASTGAATFSSSITATSAIFANSSVLSTIMGTPQLRLINNAGSTINQRVDLGLRFEDGTYNGIGGISMVRESATARSGTIVIQPINSSGDPLAALSITSSGAATFSSSVTAGAIDSTGVSFFRRAGLVFTLNPSFAGGDVYSQLQSTGALALASGGDNNRLYITSAGNVGIGTTAPTARLQISANAGVDVLNVAGYDVLKWDTGDILTFGGYKSSQWNVVALATAGSERMRITSTGNVGIGTTSPGYKLEVVDSGTSTIRIKGNSTTGLDLQNDSGGSYFWNRDNTPVYIATNNTERMRITSGGNMLLGTTSDNGERLYVSGDIRATGTITANSDLTLKKNLLKIENALEKVEQINGYTYEFKSDDSKRHAGLIAQEVEIVLPEIVNAGADKIKGIEYGNISALLVEAIKELSTEINIIKKQINN